MVYADSAGRRWWRGFTRNTFTAMIEGVREQAIKLGMIKPEAFDEGIRDLYRTTEGKRTDCFAIHSSRQLE